MIPIPIQLGVHELEVEAPDGRLWSFGIPNDPPDDYELRVDLDGPGYTGWLERAGDHKPLADVIVRATEGASPGKRVRSYGMRTDKEGRFGFSGLEPGKYTLRFENSSDGPPREEVDGVRFVPRELPASPPALLSIRIPTRVDGKLRGLEECTISGIVRVAGFTIDRGQIYVTSHFDIEGGELAICPRNGRSEVDMEGRYRVRVPCAPRYSVILFPKRDPQRLGPIEFGSDTGARAIEQDLDFR